MKTENLTNCNGNEEVLEDNPITLMVYGSLVEN